MFYERVTRVVLNTGDRSSNASYYSNYTETVFTTLTNGQTYTLKVEGYAPNAYPEYMKAWIDYNQDQDFTDAGEEIDLGSHTYTGAGAYNFSNIFTVSPTALQGNTRLRVSMKWSTAPSPCDSSIAYGEVEDYTVTISSGQIAITKPTTSGVLVSIIGGNVEVAGTSNRASGQAINITVSGLNSSTLNTVVNTSGGFNATWDTSGILSGYYTLYAQVYGKTESNAVTIYYTTTSSTTSTTSTSTTSTTSSTTTTMLSTTTTTYVTTTTNPLSTATAVRNLPSNVNPGQTFTVTIPITMGSGVIGAGVVEFFPTGWSVSAISLGGFAKTSPDRIEWIIFTGSNLTNSTVSYKLTVPANASGTANFAGNLSVSTWSGTVLSQIGGASSVSIVQGCSLKGDYSPCNEVSISEILNLIIDWVQGKATISDVLALIAAWAS